MSALTITHTAEDGTQLEGTRRGDGTYEIITALNTRIGRYWKWSRLLDCWTVYRSRDRQPNTLAIKAAAEALRESGHTVTLDIDRTHRDPAAVAADRAAQRRARADTLRDKADRHQCHADRADAVADRAHESLPPGGEPIKEGHHSERRHRRMHERAQTTAEKAGEARRKAAETHHRAQMAEHTASTPDSPTGILRRIERMEADQRADERARDGYTRRLGINGQTGHPILEVHAPANGAYRERLLADIAQRADEIAYERERLDAAREAGAVLITAPMIRPGDYVHTGRMIRPEPVVKVNKSTVTLDVEPGWNNKLPINTITGITNSAGQRISFDRDDRRSDEYPTTAEGDPT